MAYAGIDYGLGVTNIDKATGIRYGVIAQNAVEQAWYDSAEADYGKPTCGECGNEAIEASAVPEDEQDSDWYEGKDYACLTCKRSFWSDDAYSEEPLGWSYDSDGYMLVDCLDSDIMVIKSPYYTFGPFCSPCVPGGISLPDDTDDPATDDTGNKAYCLGHDWFEGDKAPYRVFRVSDDSEVTA